MLEPMTVKVCNAIKACPTGIDELCEYFQMTRKKMRAIISHLVRYGCIRADGTRHSRKAIYHFVRMPVARPRGKGRNTIIREARKIEPTPAGYIVRPYQPVFKPLQGRDQFAHWRLREDSPETSTAAVHSCRI